MLGNVLALAEPIRTLVVSELAGREPLSLVLLGFALIAVGVRVRRRSRP